VSTSAPVTGPEQLAAVLDAAGPALRGLIERTERRLEEIAASHGPELTRHSAATLGAGGKRLRPMLVFICAGDADSDDLVRAGAAVELLHTATLVHDDVLDHAALRRGRPTVFSSAGAGTATAVGDFLFSRAFADLTGTGNDGAVRALAFASSALARGELMQREDAWSADVSRDRYLERCDLKTARLFEAACRLGALLGAPGPRAADALGAFGSRVGVAFQIFDDVLDVSGPVERTGKPRGTDLLDGTVTLPLIVARERDSSLSAIRVETAADAEAVCGRIATTGALEESRRVALEHVAAAKDELRAVELNERQRRALELVADGVVERYG
jgi:geranylgeranyl pyrophosphate synthase